MHLYNKGIGIHKSTRFWKYIFRCLVYSADDDHNTYKAGVKMEREEGRIGFWI